jgi:hypothetical protein
VAQKDVEHAVNVWDELAKRLHVNREFVKRTVFLLAYGGSIDPWLSQGGAKKVEERCPMRTIDFLERFPEGTVTLETDNSEVARRLTSHFITKGYWFSGCLREGVWELTISSKVLLDLVRKAVRVDFTVAGGLSGTTPTAVHVDDVT